MSSATQELDLAYGSLEYEEARVTGADRATLINNLVESNFHGLRKLRQYVMAGQEKRQAFILDLSLGCPSTGGRVDSCPFPFEVSLLRALCMGFHRYQGRGGSAREEAEAFIESVRFGVHAPHLPGVVEYEPQVFFRAFQGIEVHRDVSPMEDSTDTANCLDWMDYRIYQIPSLEKDFVWDLMQMQASPWAKRDRAVLHMENASDPEQKELSRKKMPVMVGRQANRLPADGKAQPVISMANPGSSLHLSFVSGSPVGILNLIPILAGAESFEPKCPGKSVQEVRPGDHWLVVTYQPPPPLVDARMLLVPPQIDFAQETSND